MQKFLIPPTVTGTLGITIGDIDLSKERRCTPIGGDKIQQMAEILTGNIKTTIPVVRPTQLEWTQKEEELLKVRWPIQGQNIPELRQPDHPALKGFFTGKFTADEIARKAVSLRLINKSK